MNHLNNQLKNHTDDREDKTRYGVAVNLAHAQMMAEGTQWHKSEFLEVVKEKYELVSFCWDNREETKPESSGMSFYPAA